MDQETNATNETPMETPMTPAPEEKTSASSIVAILVIVLVLAFGAFYFLKQVPTPADNATLSPAEIQNDASISALSTQGTSTDIANIEADLNATNLSGVDAGLSDIAI